MAGRGPQLATGMVASLLLLGACSGGEDAGTRDRDGDTGAESADTGSGSAGTVEPVGSAGCGSSTVPLADQRVTLMSGSDERWYLRHLPPVYDGTQPQPVVVDFHGYSEGAEVHLAHSELAAFGDEHGFVTLTPQGQGPVPRWDAVPGSIDVRFVGDLLDHAEATLCVDRTRVYIAGLSNGAMMTSVAACVLADRVAAAAPVAGVIDVGDCEADRAVPVVSFHGTDDPFLAYEGGYGPAVANLPAPDGEGTLGDLDQQDAAELDDTATAEGASVPEVMGRWAERNGCDGEAPAETEVANDVTLLSYGCPAGAEVELYRIEGGGHTWPGSPFLDGVELVGPTTSSISANEVMWEFFEGHPLDLGV